MAEKMRSKKGQVGLWVIVALVIVGAIILFFTLRQLPTLTSKAEFDPQQFIDKCARDSVNEAVDKMLPQGGFLNPGNFKVYNSIKIAYLCENEGYFRPCINQHPMFINEMKNEILGYIRPRMENCFESMKTTITSRRGSIELGAMSLNISAAPGKIYVDVIRKTTITEGGSTRIFDNFKVEVANPLYDLGNVAIEIANNEAKYCYFEYVGYMILYPNWDIRKFTMSDSAKIYTIKDKSSGKTINIAMRGCAMPAGI